MSDTQPPEPSILDSLTRDELIEAILLREHERDAFHDANTAAAKIAAFNLRGWRTALARAMLAESALETANALHDEACEERNVATRRHDALVIECDRLRAELAAAKGSQQPAPEGAPRFKAGQRVRFVSKIHGGPVGAVGTIVTVRPDGLYSVDFPGSLANGCYAEDQLAPEGDSR